MSDLRLTELTVDIVKTMIMKDFIRKGPDFGAKDITEVMLKIREIVNETYKKSI